MKSGTQIAGNGNARMLHTSGPGNDHSIRLTIQRCSGTVVSRARIGPSTYRPVLS